MQVFFFFFPLCFGIFCSRLARTLLSSYVIITLPSATAPTTLWYACRCAPLGWQWNNQAVLDVSQHRSPISPTTYLTLFFSSLKFDCCYKPLSRQTRSPLPLISLQQDELQRDNTEIPNSRPTKFLIDCSIIFWKKNECKHRHWIFLGSQSKRPLIINDDSVAFLTNLISKNLISPFFFPSERSSDSSADVSLKHVWSLVYLLSWDSSNIRPISPLYLKYIVLNMVALHSFGFFDHVGTIFLKQPICGATVGCPLSLAVHWMKTLKQLTRSNNWKLHTLMGGFI